jgi:hypothetical protein
MSNGRLDALIEALRAHARSGVRADSVSKA